MFWKVGDRLVRQKTSADLPLAEPKEGDCGSLLLSVVTRGLEHLFRAYILSWVTPH